ncbi:MAG: hypothetical protein ABW043_16975 [Devosia sp.]|uniref:hypothetical protein n=1 Tax=Devosia sp. TaxID=1871048 RepID=UPI003394344F
MSPHHIVDLQIVACLVGGALVLWAINALGNAVDRYLDHHARQNAADRGGEGEGGFVQHGDVK